MSKRVSKRGDVFGLISCIYDAALQPELWSGTLERISDAFKGSTLVVHFGKLDSPEGFSATARADPRLYELYMSGYLTPDRNPGIAPLFSAQPGAIIRREAVASDDEFRRSDFYNDIFRPHVLWHWMFGPVLKEAPYIGVFGISRRPTAGPFDRREFDLLRCLMPHLQRALQISVRLHTLEAARQGLEKILVYLPIGVILLDAEGRVLLINPVAESIAAAADGLKVKDRRLIAATASETANLRRLIADAAATGASVGTGAGGAITLSRPSLKRPLTVLIAPLQLSDNRGVPHQPAAAVFVSDPERSPETPAAILHRLYGFTQKEAALAAMVVQGHGLKRAADCLGMTFETARGHMKVILEKTGTHRQAELVQLLLRSPAALRFN